MPIWAAEVASKLRGMKGASLLGAGAGALGLGAAGAYLGSGEGMMMDALENEMRDKKRRELGG